MKLALIYPFFIQSRDTEIIGELIKKFNILIRGS